MTQRSCFELGACQSRKPACQGCEWRFAPGAIEGPFKRARHRFAFSRASRFGKTVLVIAAATLVLTSVSLVTGFSVGYINPMGLFR